MRPLALIEAAVAGVLLVVLTVGLGVIVVGIPSFTRHVSSWAGAAELSGLEQETAEETAELVRAFTISGDVDTLPSEVDGREGFDEKTIAHLQDVRAVVTGVRMGTGIAAALLAAWTAWSLVKGRTEALVRGLRAGAMVTGALTVMVLLAAAFDFDAVFVLFHAIFFESGTWTFPTDSLIIQLFPTAFWAAAGSALALWVLAGVGLMLWGASAAKHSSVSGSMTSG